MARKTLKFENVDWNALSDAALYQRYHYYKKHNIANPDEMIDALTARFPNYNRETNSFARNGWQQNRKNKPNTKPRDISEKYTDPEYWASMATPTLNIKRAKFFATDQELPPLMIEELKKRHGPNTKISKDQPRARVATVQDTTNQNIITVSQVDQNQNGIYYDIFLNGERISQHRLHPQFHVGANGHAMVMKFMLPGDNDAFYDIFMPNGKPFETARRSRFTGNQLYITDVNLIQDGFRIKMSDSSTEDIVASMFSKTDAKYNLSQVPKNIPTRMFDKRRIYKKPTDNSVDEFDDGNYHIFREPLQNGKYNIYLNKQQILHQVDGIDPKPLFNDGILVLRVLGTPEEFFIFDSLGKPWSPNVKMPVNLRIKNVKQEGLSLKIILSNGYVRFMNCHSVADNIRDRHKYKIH